MAVQWQSTALVLIRTPIPFLLSQTFLSSNGFIHRDLAARNILLGEDKWVKISDFGLMRRTEQDVYKLSKGKKLPYKWMAPEALCSCEYTTKSDV